MLDAHDRAVREQVAREIKAQGSRWKTQAIRDIYDLAAAIARNGTPATQTADGGDK